MRQSSLNVKTYPNYPLQLSCKVVKVYEGDNLYLFDVEPLYDAYDIIEKCLLFCPFSPKLDDIVAVTFLNNYTMPVIFGVMQKPEKVSNKQEYKMEHPSGSKQTMKANGDVEINDKHGNIFEMTAEGVKINDHYLVTLEFLQAMLQTDAANLGMGNLTAPVPVNPITLAKWLPKITKVKPDTFITDKLSAPEV